MIRRALQVTVVLAALSALPSVGQEMATVRPSGASRSGDTPVVVFEQIS